MTTTNDSANIVSKIQMMILMTALELWHQFLQCDVWPNLMHGTWMMHCDFFVFKPTWCMPQCNALPNLICVDIFAPDPIWCMAQYHVCPIWFMTQFDAWSNLIYGPIWCMTLCDTWWPFCISAYLMQGTMWLLTQYDVWPNLMHGPTGCMVAFLYLNIDFWVPST